MIVSEGELQQRLRDKEAAPTLVEPFRSVVRAAQVRFAEGLADNASLFLKNKAGDRMFVVDPSSQSGGLEISGMELNESGEPLRGLSPVSLPIEPDQVSVATLLHLRGVDPVRVTALAQDILTADRISNLDYYRVVDVASRGCN